MRRALAATTMAVAAAGSGLLIAAASAVPAYAAAPSAPHRGHTTRITFTAHPRAGAAHGIGSQDVLPCAEKPGAAMKPASCGQQTITCVISQASPMLMPDNNILTSARVDCDSDVDQIDFNESLLKSGGSTRRTGQTVPDFNTAGGFIQLSCSPGTYTNTASATITFPAGYVITGGTNPIHITSPAVTITCPTAGGGGGGGGGCAIHAPSLAGHLAGRHPDLISCQ
jgi:hypothetical protein